MAVRITGEDRIKLLATLAVEVFKALPDTGSADHVQTKHEAEAYRATKAVDIAHMILEDATNRTNGR
jgi:hypothetical protein